LAHYFFLKPVPPFLGVAGKKKPAEFTWFKSNQYQGGMSIH